MQHQPDSIVINGPDRCAGSSRAEILGSQFWSNPAFPILVEAHDGLSGAIAESAGFKSPWASGFSIARPLRFRDANEARWTQLVNVVERQVCSTELPVLVDGDIDLGDFDNARLWHGNSLILARWIRTGVAPSWSVSSSERDRRSFPQSPSDIDGLEGSSSIHFWLLAPVGVASEQFSRASREAGSLVRPNTLMLATTIRLVEEFGWHWRRPWRTNLAEEWPIPHSRSC
ncbi:isocitrate lyase/phosphoenolpyruvate mutase family protein [Bradyrhizobium valentinum]|uniref:isocitrate lyase/phosphoenolpyruvate mutase family protein n=1 Tax=Bradyrhizobium valentinum TaxID=1518501 RepID=UPI0009ECA747